VPRTSRDFAGDSLEGGPLGWNFMNVAIRLELLRYLDRQPGVELAFGSGFARLLARTEAALVTLTDGRQIAARLAIAADGRASALREAAGIGTRTRRYGQKALAFAVTHPEPHHGISTELYLDGGPFTMVPLPDRDGVPASAVVWCNDGPQALHLHQLSVPAFEAAATERSAGVLGPLSLATGRALWPVVTQRAERLTGTRLALIAEAAHVLPPIGAQGLNTSVNDNVALTDLVRQAPDTIGDSGMLAAYEAARARDIAARAGLIDLYNRVTRAPDALSQALRRIGLRAVHDIAPLRARVMRAGMGPG
jgi:2-octaprenyl-6-methoxyphenol hydroxylase